jgi:cysteine desulfurase/selenocysteine lyase
VTFDPLKIRKEFPLLRPDRDGRRIIYLDNAATAQVPEAVLAAVAHHERSSRANVHRGVYRLAEAATRAYENARDVIAGYVNAATREEIVFTSGATASLNLVAHSLGETLQAGDEVLISELEHHSNIVPWQLLRDRRGITLKALPATPDGRIDLDALDRLVNRNTKLIAVTHVSNVTGAVTDVARVVAAARSVGARVLLDGAQAAPHGPLDVQDLDVDFYALTGHKMYGPNGIGVLWARREILETMPPFLGGGEMIRSVTIAQTEFAPPPARFEAGTPPIANAVGLAAAAIWIEDKDTDEAHAHLDRLTGRLLDGLAVLGNRGVRVVGPLDTQGRYATASFDIEGVHPHDVCQLLDARNLCLRGGHHCAQPLMEAMGVTGTSRASLAFYSSDEDIDLLLNGIEDVARKFGSAGK